MYNVNYWTSIGQFSKKYTRNSDQTFFPKKGDRNNALSFSCTFICIVIKFCTPCPMEKN